MSNDLSKLNQIELQLADISKQQAELDAKARALAAEGRKEALAMIRHAVNKFGITFDDLAPFMTVPASAMSASTGSKSSGPAVYRNERGETWTAGSQGRPPKWVVEIRKTKGDLEKYRI